MNNSLSGKRVFITGGAKGIGKALVVAFCKAECKVAFCDIDDFAGMQLYKELSDYDCRYYHIDVSDKIYLTELMHELFSEWKDMDIIINNVGISKFRSILDTTIEDFENILDINLRTVFITSKLLAERRSAFSEKNTYGRIINIASTRYLMSEPDSEAYAASKGGIVSLTHALAVSLGKYNITVNCVSPGWIETGDYSKLTESDHMQHPAGRVGTPEDIARVCMFICQPENNFIDAQNIIVDGGMTKKMIYEE